MASIFSYTRTIGTGTLMIALMMVIMTGCARQPTLNASRDLISVTVITGRTAQLGLYRSVQSRGKSDGCRIRFTGA